MKRILIIIPIIVVLILGKVFFYDTQDKDDKKPVINKPLENINQSTTPIAVEPPVDPKEPEKPEDNQPEKNPENDPNGTGVAPIENDADINPEDNRQTDDINEEINVPIKGTEKYYADAKLVKPPYHMLILVNKKNVLKEDYVPEDLKKLEVFAPGRQDSVKYMREEAADAIIELVKGAEEDGYEILPTSGYRSYNLQQIIFEGNVSRSGSVDKANETSALPGQSEHQSGLAMDVSCASVNYQITDAFGDTPEAVWVAENANKYGFIIRYQEGKEGITGYTYEPWHLRYVGLEPAKYIFDNDLTLEEYSAN